MLSGLRLRLIYRKAGNACATDTVGGLTIMSSLWGTSTDGINWGCTYSSNVDMSINYSMPFQLKYK